MAKQNWGWVLNTKSAPVKLTALDKLRIEAQFKDTVQSYNERFAEEETTEKDEKGYNYPVLFFTKWHNSFFYITTKYRCPSPLAREPYFEMGLARVQITGADKCNLAYLRHTGKWEPIYDDISIEIAKKSIQEDPWFNVF